MQTVVLCAFQRANTERLDLMKRSAPRLVSVEHALHMFLNSNVLPLAKSRNLLEAHRTFQEDEDLQRSLSEHADALFQHFVGSRTHASSAVDKQAGGGDEREDGAGEGEGIDIDQFVQGLSERGLLSACELQLSVWETTITPVQPGEMGHFVTRSFKSSFTAVDAKQAFLDTLLADALLISSTLPADVGTCSCKLPFSGLLEAVVRCAMAKYSAVTVLTTAGKTASIIDRILNETDEQGAVNKFVDTHAPARFDAEGATIAPAHDPSREAEQKVWLKVWQQLDLSDLPGFPEWDGAAFEQLQANWPTLLSIFVFYSRGYGGHANGVHGFITPWGFLQWADDSKVITKIFSDARVQEVCEFTCAKAGGGGAATSGGSGRSNLQMSFPCFLQAIVRCAVERANPRWRRDESGRLTTGVLAAYLIPVPDCLGRFLYNCVLRFSPRDPGLSFSQQLQHDEQAKAAVEQRHNEVSQLLGQVAGGVEAPLSDSTCVSFDVQALIQVLQERGALGQALIDLRSDKTTACELTEEQVRQAAIDAASFVKGRATAGNDGVESSGLSPEAFVELLVRCAHLKYANVPGMSLAQRVSAFLRIILDGATADSAMDIDVARPSAGAFDPAAEPPPPNMSDDDHDAWIATWAELDFRGLPGYESGARNVYLVLRKNVLQLQDIFCQYSKNGSVESSIFLETWEAFVLDANLVTRAIGVQRTRAVFDHAAIKNKLGQPVLRLPQFLQALVHMAYLRSNPVSVLSGGSKPTPLPKAVDAVIQHLFSRYLKPPPKPPRPPPLATGSTSAEPVSHRQASPAKRSSAPSQRAGRAPPPSVGGLPPAPGAGRPRGGAESQRSRAGTPPRSPRAASPGRASPRAASPRAASPRAASPRSNSRGTALQGAPAPASGNPRGAAQPGAPAPASGGLHGSSAAAPSSSASSHGAPGPVDRATGQHPAAGSAHRPGESGHAPASAPAATRPVPMGRPAAAPGLARARAQAGGAAAPRIGGGAAGSHYHPTNLVKRGRGMADGLLPSMRKNLYMRMFKAWRDHTKVSVVESKVVVAKFRETKRGGKLTYLFKSWKSWLQEWNSAINEAGFILRPHLPLNQHSAFSHWRYWSHAPQLMTSVATWYMMRVSTDDFAKSSQYTHDTVLRAVHLKQSFSRWEKLHAQTVRAVSMTNHLQRRLCATLLLRVVDAWVRLTIQEHGARLYKERRTASANAPRVPPPPGTVPKAEPRGAPEDHASAADAELFLNRELELRATAARPGAHAWALLEAKLQMHHLPGISEFLPRIHTLLQENLPSLCSVFRSYAKLHIQPSEGLLSLSCLQLHEWLLFCEEVGLSSVTEPQQQLLMASQFENAQRRHLHGGLMSLPEFLEAFVCTSVLARREDSRGHSIDVVTRVQRSLESLQPLVARDMAPGFRMTFWADTQAMKLLDQHDAELRQVFLKRGWLKGGGVSLADFEAHVLELGLVCEAYWVQPLGSAGCELSMTLEQVMEAFVDSLDMFAGEESLWLPTGLPYEGWLECLARCAVGLYGPLELLKLHQLLDCILRNILTGLTIEQSANAVWLETRDALANLGSTPSNPGSTTGAGAAAGAKAASTERADPGAANAAKKKKAGGKPAAKEKPGGAKVVGKGSAAPPLREEATAEGGAVKPGAAAVTAPDAAATTQATGPVHAPGLPPRPAEPDAADEAADEAAATGSEAKPTGSGPRTPKTTGSAKRSNSPASHRGAKPGPTMAAGKPTKGTAAKPTKPTAAAVPAAGAPASAPGTAPALTSLPDMAKPQPVGGRSSALTSGASTAYNEFSSPEDSQRWFQPPTALRGESGSRPSSRAGGDSPGRVVSPGRAVSPGRVDSSTGF